MLEPDALRHTLERAGFTSVTTSLERIDHRHDPQRFLELRLELAKPWLASLPAADLASLVASIRARLDALSNDDFVDPTQVIMATAQVPGC